LKDALGSDSSRGVDYQSSSSSSTCVIFTFFSQQKALGTLLLFGRLFGVAFVFGAVHTSAKKEAPGIHQEVGVIRAASACAVFALF